MSTHNIDSSGLVSPIKQPRKLYLFENLVIASSLATLFEKLNTRYELKKNFSLRKKFALRFQKYVMSLIFLDVFLLYWRKGVARIF